METTPNGWQIIDEDSGVLSYEYNFGAGKANAFAARIDDGSLMVISPPKGFTDAAADDLKAFGEVSTVIAPNGFHHLGLPEWKKRYPDARFLAAAESAMRIQKKNPDAPTLEPLSLMETRSGEDVGVTEVPNTKVGETWAWVRTGRGYVFFCSDVLANMPALPKGLVGKMLFKLSGSGPGFKVFHLALKFYVNDKQDTLNRFRADVAAHPPSVIVFGHGATMEGADLAEKTDALLASAIK